MKQRLLLTAFLFSTLFSFAQIETFDASQLSSSTPVKPTKSGILKHVDYPISLPDKPLDIIGHDIYLVADHVKEVVGPGWPAIKYDCPCVMISINKEGTEVKVTQAVAGRTYKVTNVLCLDEEYATLRNRINNCGLVTSDQLSYPETIRGFFDSKTRKKGYQFTKEDVIKLLGVDFHNACYELLDEDGNTYYISAYKRKNITIKGSSQQYGSGTYTISLAHTLSIDKFVSMTTFNYFNENYVGKPLVSLNSKTLEDVYVIKKIVVENEYNNRDKINTLYVLYSSMGDDQVKVNENVRYGKVSYGLHSQDSVFAFAGFVRRYEADSILHLQEFRDDQKLQAEENERLQREAAERARHEAELAERARKQEANKQALIKKYGEAIGMRIFNGEIWIGMTKEQCLESVGLPCDSQSRQNVDGTYEIYKYNCHWASYGIGSVFYVHIINNKVVQIDR